jgi:class 3 adenylate cyclase/predicted ATPase
MHPVHRNLDTELVGKERALVNFARVLKEVLWCLVTEGGISYRRVRLTYGLDDDAVEELRRELISVKRLAADVDGERLVWAPDGSLARNGRAGLPPHPLPPLRLVEPMPTPAKSPARDLPGAERRQLTVMFCDLADSTRLSAELDPEEMSDVIRTYQDFVSEAVRRFDGFIAKFMGDGVLVYFGYPYAQGNDAARAVHSGLAIIEALPALNHKVGGRNGLCLAVRIGIATGLVVVGETIGEGAAREQTVVGDTPNLAARLQGAAAPNSILISSATHDIVDEVFACDGLGAHVLKGVTEPVHVWRITGLREADEVEFETAAGDFPLVGRDEEIGMLRRAWQQTKEEGHGQVVFIGGEPGIGKSSLVDMLRRTARDEGFTRMTIRCSPYHTNSALHPVIEHFRRIAGWQAEDDDKARFAKLEQLLSGFRSYSQDLVPLFAALMSVPLLEKSGYAALDLTPERLKERTEEALVTLNLEEAERRPVVAVWEDVHWADPSTLEVLGQLIDQVRLRDGLGRLVEAELLYQRGRPPRSRYIFKHALIQDAAYQSLLRRTRQQYHRQVAELIESEFADTVETSPELVAHHYSEAGMPTQAVKYWLRAGERAVKRSAAQEAIGHLTTGLEQLGQLTDTPERARLELAMQRLLGQASFATRGYASPQASLAFSRARELSAVVGEDSSIFPILFGVWLFELTSGQHANAETTANEFLAQADRMRDIGGLISGNLAVGISGVHVARLAQAHTHFDRAIEIYRASRDAGDKLLTYEYGLELGATSCAYAAWCLWLLGYPDQGLSLGNQALTIAEESQHGYTRIRGLYWNSIFHALRREWPLVEARAATAIAFAKERGLAMVVAVGQIMHGAARAMLNPSNEAITEMRVALAAYRATGARFQITSHLILLAQALTACGRHDEGLSALHEAGALVEETGERYVVAEINRLRGNLLLAQGEGVTAVEASYSKALEVSRAQEARSFELRAASDLARLWAEHGERGRAADLLEPIYDRFTEGLDTIDLKEAKALLDSLAS